MLNKTKDYNNNLLILNKNSKEGYNKRKTSKVKKKEKMDQILPSKDKQNTFPIRISVLN